MIILLLVLLGLFALTYLYFFREAFLAELAISFLPYICVGLIVLSLISLIVLIYRIMKRRKREKFNFFDCRISLGMLLLLFLWSGVLGILYGMEFFSFYSMSKRVDSLENDVSVYYANILYTNYDYLSLEQQIEESNADIVVLVEFSDEHAAAMKDFFQENYPYVNRNSRNSRLAGDVVFSKYPITNVLEKYPQEAGKWRYSYLKLTIEYPIYLYVVHTSAPVSEYNFAMRNSQLDRLNQDFWIHEQDREDNAYLLMIGDFNISPWSAFYEPFENAFNGRLVNALRRDHPTYTWSLRDQNLLVSHIDHLFVSSGINLSTVTIGDLPGSDHNPLLFSFSVNEEK